VATLGRVQGEVIWAFREFSLLRTHFRPLIQFPDYTPFWRMSRTDWTPMIFQRIFFNLRGQLRRPKQKIVMAKSKKHKNKAKLNLTVRDEQRNQLEQMASLENRSLSNLIEVMADERWKRLAEQQGVAYAKTVAEAMKLKLDMDNPADREKLRRAVLDLVAGKKTPKQKRPG
jgi:uncharacterized protein (DUF1778 family)